MASGGAGEGVGVEAGVEADGANEGDPWAAAVALGVEDPDGAVVAGELLELVAPPVQAPAIPSARVKPTRGLSCRPHAGAAARPRVRSMAASYAHPR